MVVYKQSTDVLYASFFLKTLFGANSYEGQCTELLSDENSQISLLHIFFDRSESLHHYNAGKEIEKLWDGVFFQNIIIKELLIFVKNIKEK